MVDNHVAVETRTSFGKGAARKLRASGKIPAVVYGHGADPLHVALPAHETTLIARR
ncbi:MAG: 50S ribosomal protein L25, partial [Pontimonas sp.]